MPVHLGRIINKSAVLRGTAITLLAAAMPLGLHVAGDGVTVGPLPAQAGNHGGGDNGNHGEGNNGNHGGGGVGAAGNHDNGVEHPDNHGRIASGLGQGNAAHANPKALENAAFNSQVGIVARAKGAYEI